MEKSQDICQQWVTIVDVVFGGIITLGYQRLEESLKIAIKESIWIFWRRTFTAFVFLFFVIYDVGVYHVIIKTYPYAVTALSGGRYVSDLLMAFALLIILVRGLSPNAERSGLEILIALTVWHLGAISWHLLAHFEKHHVLAPIGSFLPHIIFISLYWTLLVVVSFVRYGRLSRAGLLRNLTSVAYISSLSVLLLAVSIYRSVQILKMFGIEI